VNNVSKIYNTGTAALSDITFSVEKGEFVFLVGPSGSGKTTLFRLLIRDTLPSKGSININKLELTKLPKKKIFVADDQEEVLSMLKDFLASKSYEVAGSKDPKQLVELVKNFNPDLILLDLLMPDLDGFEICRILNNDPEAQAIPIIIMSGLSDLVDIKRAYQLGGVGYLIKPFNMKVVLAEIEKAISNKENPQ